MGNSRLRERKNHHSTEEGKVCLKFNIFPAESQSISSQKERNKFDEKS